jgi:hypothetical protein
MTSILQKLPSDIVFHEIQDFIGKEKIIYFNKYVNEYRMKLCKNNVLYNNLNKLFENCSIIYNKNGGGSVLEIGSLKPRGYGWFVYSDNGFNHNKFTIEKNDRFVLTHIVYEQNKKLYTVTELCKIVEHFDPDPDDDPVFRDVPDLMYYHNFYIHSTKI